MFRVVLIRGVVGGVPGHGIRDLIRGHPGEIPGQRIQNVMSEAMGLRFRTTAPVEGRRRIRQTSGSGSGGWDPYSDIAAVVDSGICGGHDGTSAEKQTQNLGVDN